MLLLGEGNEYSLKATNERNLALAGDYDRAPPLSIGPELVKRVPLRILSAP
jgi:hypothetical protein